MAARRERSARRCYAREAVTREEESEPVASDGDAEEHREVYARFGLAYSLAECVHRGLVNVFAYLRNPSRISV
jgi:hypothetical protein